MALELFSNASSFISSLLYTRISYFLDRSSQPFFQNKFLTLLHSHLWYLFLIHRWWKISGFLSKYLLLVKTLGAKSYMAGSLSTHDISHFYWLTSALLIGKLNIEAPRQRERSSNLPEYKGSQLANRKAPIINLWTERFARKSAFARSLGVR